MKKYRYYIGIDTGVNTGICVWDAGTKLIRYIETISIHKAMNEIKSFANCDGSLFVRVEDARLRKWIPKMLTERRERGRNQGAGSVMRDAKIWEDFLTDLGVDFEMVAPKNNKTKLNAEAFRKMTGYQGKTTEHARDSAMLVYGL